MEREDRSAITFDRAVEYYDRTRGLTADAMERLLDVLQTELASHRCLELGIGTGRIGVPLMERSIDLTGVDISDPMLRKLLEKRSGASVVQGDATRLPFPTGSFGRALAVHVLHLIPDWRGMLDEMARVTKQGGALVVNDTEDFGDMWGEIARRFREAAGMSTPYVGVTDLDQVDAYLGQHGATPRQLPETEEKRSYTPAELIARLEDGLYSFTWKLDEETRRSAGAAVREWVTSEYGSVDNPIENRYLIGWRAYDLP
jgi:ubiquinone/menaquinone biosynthesis C-methylase UbiE